jgi:hypothetical protein
VEARLTDIETVYNFDFGDEFEVAICLLLKDILPSKYGICRGFVVSEAGDTAGDDLIIYDRMACPTLRTSQSLEFAVKQQVPMEAVYAYIECKHSINKEETLEKAMKQVRGVKSLLLSRESLPNENYESDGPKYNGKVRDWPRQQPRYKNQPFCVIATRHFSAEWPTKIELSESTPDLIILGTNHLATQSVILGPDGIKGALFYDSDFWSGLRLESVDKNAWGIGIVLLLQALSMIELVPIDWTHSLNHAFANTVFGQKKYR